MKQNWQEKSPFSEGETGFCRIRLDQAIFVRGARGGTRTRTVLPPSGPKPGASTNFATRAVLITTESKTTLRLRSIQDFNRENSPNARSTASFFLQLPHPQ